MDKLKMAHEYALEMLKETIPTGSLYGDEARSVAESIVKSAFALADMMQAEANKRSKAESVITDQDKQRIEQAYSNIVKPPIVKEWQPDWSQAPEWANWWAMDGTGDSYWHSCVDEPFINESIFEIANPQGHTFDAPSFNYQGNWKDSLRKRPTNI